MAMDKEFLNAIMGSVLQASKNPMELVKMMNGARLDFRSCFDDVPLDVSIRIKDNEILARVKILEKESNGDPTETH